MFLLSFRCLVSANVSLQCAIVLFPNHSHFLFGSILGSKFEFHFLGGGGEGGIRGKKNFRNDNFVDILGVISMHFRVFLAMYKMGKFEGGVLKF